jgi:cell division protein ZapA
MAHVSVTIDNRRYRLACNEGEEARIESLAGMIDEKVNELRGSFGEIGDSRLVVMAALTIADNLTEAREQAASARQGAEAAEARAASIAASIEALGARIEALAERLAGAAEA